MSAVLELRKELGIASERVLRMERAVRDNPDLPSVLANLESAVRIRDRLIAQFTEATVKAGYDIFSYRAFDDDNQTKVGGAFKVIADFQTLVSVVHSAVSSGQKRMNARFSREVADETTFGFGYALVGSLEVVLTVHNQKMLLLDSPIDQTLSTVIALTQEQTSEEIEQRAKVLGPGPINALYEWVKESKRQNLGAALTWQKGDEVQASAIIQTPQIAKLGKAISKATPKVTVDETITGELIAADLDTFRFKLRRYPGTKPIKGWFEPGVISAQQKASLPQEYKAVLAKTVETEFRTATQKVTYQLIRLLPPPKRRRGSDGQGIK